jgi:hypothetical protein
VDLPHWEFVLLLVGVGLAAVAIAVPVAKGIRIAAGAFGAFMFVAAVAALFGFSGVALQWPITGIQSPILFPEPDSLKSPRPPLDAAALNGDWIHITLGSTKWAIAFLGSAARRITPSAVWGLIPSSPLGSISRTDASLSMPRFMVAILTTHQL